MRGYKDIELEIEKLLIEELPKLQIEYVIQLHTIGKVYIFVDIYLGLYLVYLISEYIINMLLVNNRGRITLCIYYHLFSFVNFFLRSL